MGGGVLGRLEEKKKEKKKLISLERRRGWWGLLVWVTRKLVPEFEMKDDSSWFPILGAPKVYYHAFILANKTIASRILRLVY